MNVREINTCNWRWQRNPAFPYVLNEDYVVSIGARWGNVWRELQFRQGGITWGTLKRGVLTIRVGYAIDGATMAPDFPEIIPACFAHDLLVQFCKVKGSPFKRCDADQLFTKIMRLHLFSLWWVYSVGVRFGFLLAKTKAHDVEIVEV